ncbi:SEC12-like protein 2 isoform X2 [Magnolia sinica]|uniref:SEC12-like protein 2 isoform X2 n=1 Tax=Magnolia sinica TaxID=86752 RepID=UPI002659B790|nr:SEC12-like protein 2 isoform X2 [Magnolia sinica]
MGRRGSPSPACCKKYGLPLYCASWIPVNQIQQLLHQQSEKGEEKKEEEQKEESGSNEQKSSSSKIQHYNYYLVLGGGGGEGRSGLSNAFLLTQFDFSSASLSEEPVNKLGTGGDLPYRMAVHPGGEGLICSFPKSCRWFEWDIPESKEVQKMALKSSGKVLTELEDVGLQLALTFNAEGSILASGGEDGHLRVFKWPSMEVLLDQPDAHASVKDLDFSSDGKFLASMGSSGPCRVWDLTSLMVVANLPRENGEVFGFCRFSRSSDDNQTLYVTAMQGQHGSIVSWNTISWERIGSKKIARDPISAFNVSADGEFLAVAVVSASFDSSARVTIIEDKKRNGLTIWAIIMIILLAIVACFVKQKGVLQ